jgi:hypothetical protein
MRPIVILLALLLAVPVVTAETQRIQVDSSEQTAGFGWGSYGQVSTHVILADGSRVALWCQQATRFCVVLQHQSYDAEVDLKRGVVWIYTQRSSQWSSAAPVDQGQGKPHKIKYRVSGSW